MALQEVASDDFTRANGGLGSNWSDTVDEGLTPEISSNQVISDGDGDAAAYWNADSFNDDQYSQITIVDTGSDYSGAVVRASATDCVFGQINTIYGGVAIVWYDGSSWTTIATNSYAVQNGDVLRTEVEGTTYSLYVNGNLKCSGVEASAPSSGASGLLVSTTGAIVDSWSGGNITAGGTRSMRQLVGHGQGTRS